jgi:CheY-like chemotaxis protein
LNGVLGMTEVLLAGEELSKGVRQRVALIHGAGEAMRTLVDDLLDMSKMDAGQIVLQRDTVDLPALLSEISRFWLTHAESAGLELSLDITGAPTMIREDARRLRQILSNLLSNAVKFTPAGSIVMSARATAVDDRERLLIRVSDSGIGVAEGSREMIFEKFTQLDASITRKYGGTGLGLSIARSLARAMGGDIKAESNAAGGADFVVTLPLERVPIDDVSERGSKAVSHALIDLRVMIVEHNPITQGALRSLLERRVDCVSFSSTIPEAIEQMGPNAAHVVIASFPKEGRSPDGATDRQMSDLARACRRTGVKLVIILGPADMAGVLSLQLLGASYLERPISAIKLAEHFEDDPVNRQVIRDMLLVADVQMLEAADAPSGLAIIDEEDLDVVLVDLRMAGMDGLTAIGHVRSRADEKAKLPLIVITADTSPNIRADCIAAGADDMLLKPVAMRDLFNVIGRVVAAKSKDGVIDL